MSRTMLVVVTVVLSGAMGVRSRAQDPGPHGGVVTITGCITLGDNAYTYKLTSARYKSSVKVTSSNELKSEVGHRVTLTGKWEKEDPKTFKADSVMKVSDSCTSDIENEGKAKPQ